MPSVNILVVDDSAYNLYVMEELLNNIKTAVINITTAFNGKEALELIYDEANVEN